MTTTTLVSGLRGPSLISDSQPKHWEDAEKASILEAFEEAMSCHKCTIKVTEATMAIDIERGSYLTTSYPPLFPNNHKRDEDISPLDISSPNLEQSFWGLINVAQRQHYYDIVEQKLDQRLLDDPTVDENIAALFAHYQVDFHINQHYLSRRGVLTLCRDASDMGALRKWQWEMHELQAIMDGVNVIPTTKKRMGWPNDGNLEMFHQIRMWKGAWQTREKHLREVRARWAIIMEERRRQREELLARSGKAPMGKLSPTVTVRLYYRGQLRDVRELERIMPVEAGVRLGQTTQSSGF
ncbi:hypothetical protein N7468_007943 [Penicillium chermesinum]|uniref:Uncharacterized protein n=1 Tax=Penicillium chermesinum TaxID=63820 RepID=A0A9W9THX1_9EURO|nr:uncharacterized protein N7468_007943 [Penicillium chermesinum]KAJ5223401.1 hypothetical protein N7468_007943 [Penicillium chermesinum]KAJ6155761.1 hypothetical protein N7470_006327 [Penicillium chermesinum]